MCTKMHIVLPIVSRSLFCNGLYSWLQRRRGSVASETAAVIALHVHLSSLGSFPSLHFQLLCLSLELFLGFLFFVLSSTSISNAPGTHFQDIHLLTETYSCNDFLNLLFVTFHFNNAFDLAKVDILSVSFRYNFVKCAKQFECISQDLSFVARPACISDNTSKQMK